MKLKRRGDEETAPLAPAENSSGTGGKKPVIIYILVLFVVAFLLMTLSLLVHQRSNAEALGALSDSVTAMKGVQNTQEKIIALQEQLAQAQEELIQSGKEQELLSQAADAGKKDAEKARQELSALSALYTLQQLYSAGDDSACQQHIQEMERRGYPALLSGSADSGVTPPAERYQELKEAVEAHLAGQ